MTRGLHVGFRAPDRAHVDAFWQAGVDAGHPDDGARARASSTGRRTTAASCSTRTATASRPSTAIAGSRSRTAASTTCGSASATSRRRGASTRRFAPHAGIALGDDEPPRVQFVGPDYSFSLIDDERPLTEHVHLAFPAGDDATVRAFHAAALAGGYEDHGAPGERADYHTGYYGAFVLDPDGHNVEVVNHNE